MVETNETRYIPDEFVFTLVCIIFAPLKDLV